MSASTSSNQSGPTLTNITHFGRLAVKYGIIGLVGLIIGRSLFSALFDFWQAMNPPPPPPPTVGFGKLPALILDQNDLEDKPLSYSLELPTANFPYFGDRAKVFFMPKSTPSLLADEAVKKTASTYGFVFEPEVMSTRIYRWTKSQPLEMSLEIDVQNQNFLLKSNYLSRSDLLANNKLPEDFEAVTKVRSFLSQADLLARDIATASGRVSYLKSLGGELSEAFSLSDADFVRVDIDRMPIDGQYEMISPDGETGVVSAIITGALSGHDGIVEMKYHHKLVDYFQVETYPLRSVESAWRIVQGGEAYIANSGKNPDVLIRKIELAYYDDWNEQMFLQPIYVFRGDGGFIALVSAIDPQLIQQSN